MRKPVPSTEYREISKQMRAQHEVGPKEETGMSERITTEEGVTVGLDLGDKYSPGCVLEDLPPVPR